MTDEAKDKRQGWLKNLTHGSAVIVSVAEYGKKHASLATVDKITPTGRIVTKRERHPKGLYDGLTAIIETFDAGGRLLGEASHVYTRLYEATEDALAKMKEMETRRKLILSVARLEDRDFRSKLTIDQLSAIDKILNGMD